MKPTFCLCICIFILLKGFTQSPYTFKQECNFEIDLAKSISDSFVVCLLRRAERTLDKQEKENLYDSSKFFSRKGFDMYIEKAATLSSKFNCKKIDEYSVVEVFLTENVHELVWFYYFIIHMKSGVNKIYIVDLQRRKTKYLGSLKRNYFVDMTEYLLGNELRHPLASGYLMHFSFTNKKVVGKVDIGTGLYSLAQFQPLPLLEKALFRKNKFN